VRGNGTGEVGVAQSTGSSRSGCSRTASAPTRISAPASVWPPTVRQRHQHEPGFDSRWSGAVHHGRRHRPSRPPCAATLRSTARLCIGATDRRGLRGWCCEPLNKLDTKLVSALGGPFWRGYPSDL